MIHYTKGNLLAAETQAFVNTVNTVGVMGKGIALQFKEAFPENFRIYAKACALGELTPGKLLVTRERTLEGEKLIVNFPTKTEWYLKSSYDYIEKGLQELARWIQSNRIRSIALPPLGCGNGGLKWERVKILIEQYLSGVNAEVVVFEPHNSIQKELTHRDKEVKLTPARAMLLYSLYLYESKGEFSSLFAANKLAYFLQRMGERLKLKFTPHHYGPYSPQVLHLLYNLNGRFLKGLEQKDAKPFELLELNYRTFDNVQKYVSNELTFEQQAHLYDLERLIYGFESTLALEALSSVDFILNEHPTYGVDEVYSAICSWSNRKKTLIKREIVEQAIERLQQHNEHLHFGS